MGTVRICVVLTTVNKGDVLDAYCKQARTEGVNQDMRIVVIPDRKSPQELYERCAALVQAGYDISCPTLSDQEKYLGKLGKIGQLIPYNSDNRRNVGFLMALDWGCDVLLSIDDDNFCINETFGTTALVCGDAQELTCIHSSNGWFNLCEMLVVEPAYRVYPRGFPYHKRHENPKISFSKETGLVRMNAGLWLQEPDCDAITWLAAPVRAQSFKGPSVMLGQDTWSPINTQNTALHRDIISAYYFVRMGYPLSGMPIDRYGDIYSGFLSQACVRHMGHRIRVGTPVADHRRNAHNYLRDLAAELACVMTLEDFTEWLCDVSLEGGTYTDSYLCLADAIDDQVERFTGQIWNDGTRGYFHQMTYCMRQWIAACRIIA